MTARRSGRPRGSPRAARVESGLQALTAKSCERLLAPGGVGVLALARSGAPVLRPVNFAVRRGSILIRTGEGQVRAAAEAASAASFVIMSADRLEHTGWSVIVTGTLSLREDAGEDVPPRPWAPGARTSLVALSIDELSGRRVEPPGAAA